MAGSDIPDAAVGWGRAALLHLRRITLGVPAMGAGFVAFPLFPPIPALLDGLSGVWEVFFFLWYHCFLWEAVWDCVGFWAGERSMREFPLPPCRTTL